MHKFLHISIVQVTDLVCQSQSELVLCAQRGNVHGIDLQEFEYIRVGFKFDLLSQFLAETVHGACTHSY